MLYRFLNNLRAPRGDNAPARPRRLPAVDLSIALTLQSIRNLAHPMAATALVDYRERKTHACRNGNSPLAYLSMIAAEIIFGLTLWVLRAY
jgi:hypothetical protein